jgi:multisubunit Na+/H+ antiporter MnhG subunit
MMLFYSDAHAATACTTIGVPGVFCVSVGA